METKKVKTAIFLGAGASAAEGAPMQSDLFRKYFAGGRYQGTIAMKKGLVDFFRLMFNIDVEAAQEKLETVDFPTFEEALGILDLAELRRESLRNFTLETTDSGNIRLIRQYLVFALALVIATELRGSIEGVHLNPNNPHPKLHQEMVNNLRAKGHLENVTFVSTNYDILIDNALLNPPREEVPGSLIDYGVEFTNFDVGERIPQQWRRWKRPDPSATRLYKIHGSLNWLYCPTCNSLTLTPGMKGAIQLIGIAEEAVKCVACQSDMTPIIVPPTFYKDMSRIFLGIVWNKTEAVLRSVAHIIFCGYSFPDADMHIKYLLKRAQTNRDDRKLRMTVVNNHVDKSREQKEAEKKRYYRFFGGNVDYTEHSFEDFATDPTGCLE